MTKAVNLAQYANNSPSWRNRFINGAMVIDQRNAGASVTPVNGAYTLDRWQTQLSQTGKFTVQQNAGSVTPPAGFRSYLGVTSTSAYSITSSDYFWVGQYIEGYNVADMNFGTADAATFTISFWVRSSLTGTFGVSIRGYDNVSTIRSYLASYTINAANTWEQKTITVQGDTTASAAWTSAQSTTNGYGLLVVFGLGVGSTNSGATGSWTSSNLLSATGATSVVGTNGATFYITGVQLEKGTAATNFEYRDYGRELIMCQRYFQYVPFSGVAANTGEMGATARFIAEMRTIPSMSTDLRSSAAYIGSTSNRLTRIGVGDAVVGSGSTTISWTNGLTNIYCTGLSSGGVYSGSCSVNAEL